MPQTKREAKEAEHPGKRDGGSKFVRMPTKAPELLCGAGGKKRWGFSDFNGSAAQPIEVERM